MCKQVPLRGHVYIGAVNTDAGRCQGCSGHVMPVSTDVGGCTVSAGATEIRERNCACEYSCLLRTQGAVAYVSTDACREQR